MDYRFRAHLSIVASGYLKTFTTFADAFSVGQWVDRKEEYFFSKRCYWNYLHWWNSRKISLAVKMIAMAPHHWSVQPVVASYISFGVGYCFIQQQRQCEKPHQLDKVISSHTLFFYPLSFGNWEGIKFYLWKKLS